MYLISRSRWRYIFPRRAFLSAFCLELLAIVLGLYSGPTSSQEQSEEAPFSVIVLEADRLIYRDDKEVVLPDGSNAIFIEVYQAHVRRIKTLSGQEIPRDAIITFAGSHLTSRTDGVSALKVVMVVRPDAEGYWGGQQWMEVGSKLCLDDSLIAKKKLEIAFSKAKRNKTGERCIGV